MRTLFTLLFLIGFWSSQSTVVAQCSPDTSLTSPGISPDTIPNATEGQAYAQVVTFLFPSDTVLFGLTFHIDSATIKSITGFPSGFQYACNNSSCMWPGGKSGCIEITGNPGAGSAGAYTLSVTITIYSQLSGNLVSRDVSNTIPFTVQPGSTNGLFISSDSRISEKLYPNPSALDQSIKWEIATGQSQQAVVSIYDVSGKCLSQHALRLQPGAQTFELQPYFPEAGIFMVRLETADQRLQKIVVRR